MFGNRPISNFTSIGALDSSGPQVDIPGLLAGLSPTAAAGGGTWADDDGAYPRGNQYRFLTGGPAAAGASGAGSADTDIEALRAAEMARITRQANDPTFLCGSVGEDGSYRDENGMLHIEISLAAQKPEAVTRPLDPAENIISNTESDSPTSTSAGIPVWLPQNVGTGVVQTWDALQRYNYTSTIKQASQQAIQKIDGAWIFNDVSRATDAAWAASETRNTVRNLTQQRVSWSGYQVSKALDRTKDVADYFANYRSKVSDPIDLAKLVATKAGSSNPWATGLAWGGRILGPAGIILGGYKGYNAIQSAPEGQKGYAATQEIAGQVAGAALGVAGAGLAVLALGSNPVGWAVIAASIAGGVAGGLGGDYAARWTVDQLYPKH